jgi:hypothetical protein
MMTERELRTILSNIKRADQGEKMAVKVAMKQVTQKVTWLWGCLLATWVTLLTVAVLFLIIGGHPSP